MRPVVTGDTRKRVPGWALNQRTTHMTITCKKTNRCPRTGRCLLGVLAFVLATVPFRPVSGQEKKNPFDEEKASAGQEKALAGQEEAESGQEKAQSDKKQNLSGQEQARLIEREPFDRLTTRNHDDKPVALELKPVRPPGEQLPRNPAPADKLRIRLFRQPELEYEIAWGDILKLERFQEMILAEAQQLVAASRFDEAYDYYAYLLKNYPKTAGLSKAVEDYLFSNASTSFREERYDEALSLLIEIHRLNPKRDSVLNAVSRVTDKVVESHVLAGEYRTARAIMRGIEERHADNVPPSVNSWRERMIAAAQKQKVAAGQHLEAGRLAEAHEASRKMVAIWPKLEGAEAVLRGVTEAYPLVAVGVMQPAAPCPPERRLSSPAARRVGRLLDRMFVERAATETPETEYFFPFGRIFATADRTGLDISVADNLPLSAFDLSQRILAVASPGHDEYRPLLGQTISEVAVSDSNTFAVTLPQPHVRPEALLVGLPVVPEGSGLAAAVRPYLADEANGSQTRFVQNENYVLAGPTQPTVIVETHFNDPMLAMMALDAGEIDVLDRVYPWQVRRLRGDDRFIVGRYAVPSVHVLELRTEKPPFTSRTFRRALVYAINREGILTRQFLNEQEMEGCVVVSGPFPEGIGENDPLAYAYDPQTKAREHKPLLAWALLKAAEAEFLAIFPDQKEGPLKRTLVLAYPADELARGACESIQRYLTMLGLKVELKELPPGQIHDPSGEYDLLYSEWSLTEPAVDVWQLLRPGGLLAHATSHLGLPLRRLGRAGTWQEVREELRQMHRIAHEDVSVVPLWQITDFYAVRKNITGVKPVPDVLYADVENWKLTPWIPEE
jgi:tetratricopeptide (TPR) repeat protein